MKVKKDGWIRKITAYDKDNLPRNINLHELLRRTLFMLFIGWPMAIILFAAVAVIYVLLYFVGFWFALRPVTRKDGLVYNWLIPIRRWPKIKGHRIWPLTVLVLYAVSYAIWQYFSGVTVAVVAVATLLIIASGYITAKFFKPELWKLTKAYISGKYHKLFLPVEFVD